MTVPEAEARRTPRPSPLDRDGGHLEQQAGVRAQIKMKSECPATTVENRWSDASTSRTAAEAKGGNRASPKQVECQQHSELGCAWQWLPHSIRRPRGGSRGEQTFRNPIYRIRRDLREAPRTQPSSKRLARTRAHLGRRNQQRACQIGGYEKRRQASRDSPRLVSSPCRGPPSNSRRRES